MARNVLSFITNLFSKEEENNEEEEDIKAAEELAMRKFRQNIANYRAQSFNVRKAPMFDYVKWMQKNNVRTEGSPDEYILQASALAPYVRTTLHTGCLGEEERKWAKLTGVAYEESITKSAHHHHLTSLSASLRASRSSRNRLG
ncbi:unnamed protein product [Dimorphilus gyrociliatus]|uniref:Uncharacterized protein n=1 Tax=Dimorphilus gyrociliatus TaxID=2664684 RepID=A0A7I8VH21_9ANNE|nr:unnamed protein product [Dimorphilus gyrociliatus]